MLNSHLKIQTAADNLVLVLLLTQNFKKDLKDLSDDIKHISILYISIVIEEMQSVHPPRIKEQNLIALTSLMASLSF